MGKQSIIKVAANDDGIRLDRWFKSHRPDVPHGLLRKLLRKGALRIDGKRAKPDQKLKKGQEIKIPEIEIIPEKERPRKKQEISERDAKDFLKNVIYKDKNIIAINKPPGLAAQGGSKVNVSVDGMLDLLAQNGERPKLVHRLDKDTSGVMLLARNAYTATKFGEAFKGKEIGKTYWAIVVGVPPQREGRINMPLATKTGAIEKTLVDEEEGKKAVTSYKVIESLGKRLSWVELTPETGRTHQLRVHMAAVGCPILGDGKYGGREAFMEGFDKKMHLHARRIIFGKLDISAPLPEHMKKTWKMLGFEEI